MIMMNHINNSYIQHPLFEFFIIYIWIFPPPRDHKYSIITIYIYFRIWKLRSVFIIVLYKTSIFVFQVYFCHKNFISLFMWRIINVSKFYNCCFNILYFFIKYNDIIRTYSMFPLCYNNFIYLKRNCWKNYNIWLWLIKK